MKTRSLSLAAVLASTAIAGGLLAGASPAERSAPVAAPASGPYAIDPTHSTLVYKIQHMGVSNFFGRFNKLSGSFNWDAAKPESTSVELTIDANSVDTNNKQRDGHLTSPDFFNAKEFPTVTFKSKSLRKAGDAWELSGDLTLLGKTKEVSGKFAPVGAKTTEKGDLAGFEVHFKFKRSDFGMKYGVEQGALGDEVEVMAGVEGNRK